MDEESETGTTLSVLTESHGCSFAEPPWRLGKILYSWLCPDDLSTRGVHLGAQRELPSGVFDRFMSSDVLGQPASLLILLLSAAVGAVLFYQSSRKKLPSWVARSVIAMTVFVSTSLYLLATLRPQTGHGQSSTSTGARPMFTVSADADVGQNILPNILDPQAIDAQTLCPGYIASYVAETANGFTANLDLAGEMCNVYGNDVENLTLLVEYQAADRINVQVRPRYIGPNNETWFILPESIIPRPVSAADDSGRKNGTLELTWTNTPTFSFSVARKSTSDVLFTTKGTKLVYEDQFIEFVTSLPDDYNLYGLGEVIHGFRLGNNLTRTFYAADVGDPIDENLYGTHPIYLDTRYFSKDSSGSLTYVANATDPSMQYQSYTHGVFLRNAHAQEVLLRPGNLTWRALGGSIDLSFYSGPYAEDVIQSYQQSTVGLPAMQQYWTLGFHQCRWGYQNWSVLQDVVDNFKEFDMPLETIWADIDYMNQYRDFTNDPVRFSFDEGAKFIDRLHANHQHWIPIVDAAIYAPNPGNPNDAYPTYDRGVQANAFMQNPDGSLYIGAVWPGYTVFPDWVGAILNGTGAFEWWATELSLWHQHMKFDGIWIDMNEVSSFCVGSCGSRNLTLNPVHPPFQLPGEPGNLVLQYPEGFNLTNATEASSAASALAAQATRTSTSTSTSTSTYLRTTPTPGLRNINYPPYAINHVQLGHDLAVHAVSPNATHHGGSVEYDFHNLFGHLILNATHRALSLISPSLRPFIIGRSTFAGSGRVAGHWGGDNASLWAYLFFSIPQALSFSIFGIPMFGVDTCGFGGNSDMELCSRWMQLSAFFPFYRNHNSIGAIGQEPYRWEAVVGASRAAMRIRYMLLPYMYTLFARASTTGSTVMRALSWEFPNEPYLAAADRQFLLGPALMVTPCLVQGASTVNGVFPGTGSGTVWYDWYNHTVVKDISPGENVTIPAPLGHIPVFVRGGYVLPLQEPGMTTYEGRKNPWSLLVALDRDGGARGGLYLDDGESSRPEEVSWVTFAATSTILTSTVLGSYPDTNPLKNVTVLGVKQYPKKVSFNGKDVHQDSWRWREKIEVLEILGLKDVTGQGAWRGNWTLSWG